MIKDSYRTLLAQLKNPFDPKLIKWTTKGGKSDALKRAANAWGIGRYLYYMPPTCSASNVSSWPKWAFPNNKIENWEDIAEMEAEIDTGMDEEEVVANTIGLLEKIKDARSEERRVGKEC